MIWRFALLLIIAPGVRGCVCSGNPPSVKQMWAQAPLVFLGTVEVADPDDETTFARQSVRIRVDEAFKGVSGGQTIDLHSDATDCDAKFRTGQRAVFYLYAGSSPGRWTLPACVNALGSVEPAGDDLLFLRGLPKSAIGTRLSGEVELYEESPEDYKRVGGVPNVRVKISGPRGVTQRTTTNASGVYEVFGLAPGRYSVSIDVPSGLKVDLSIVAGSPRVKGDHAAVELKPNGGAGVNFLLLADTRLSGRMLDAKGAPLPNVCIDLERAEGQGGSGSRVFDCSNKAGAFEMTLMPPGKYVLVVRDEFTVGNHKSESTLYYPGVRDRQRATIISIEANKYVEHLDIRLPSNEKRYRFTGRLRFADGGPAPGATVTFTAPEHGYSETTHTSADGSFGLLVIAGMDGQLNGRMAVYDPISRLCPELKLEPPGMVMFQFMDASSLSVSSDSDRENLKLELRSPSCKSRQ